MTPENRSKTTQVDGAHENRSVLVTSTPLGVTILSKSSSGGSEVALDRDGISELITQLEAERERLSSEPTKEEDLLVWTDKGGDTFSVGAARLTEGGVLVRVHRCAMRDAPSCRTAIITVAQARSVSRHLLEVADKVEAAR